MLVEDNVEEPDNEDHENSSNADEDEQDRIATQVTLPSPLQPDQPPRVDSQGFPMYNPDWTKTVSHTSVKNFLSDAVTKIIQKCNARNVSI